MFGGGEGMFEPLAASLPEEASGPAPHADLLQHVFGYGGVGRAGVFQCVQD